MNELKNPEHAWMQQAKETLDLQKLVADRLGPVSDQLELLSGGLANTNIKIGTEKVLRIYRTNKNGLSVEKALLQQVRNTFITPSVMGAGDDFLVLEYVPHRNLLDIADHGEAIGKSLAEIHAKSFTKWGFLNSNLEAENPFDDLVTSLIDFAASCFSAASHPYIHVRQTLIPFLRSQSSPMKSVAGAPCLTHSDFKVSNLHWTGAAKPLILDWETSYAGSSLSDIGQLFRWKPSLEFQKAFEVGYLSEGGRLPLNWKKWAETFDLVNLASLYEGVKEKSKRGDDVTQRIQETISNGF